MKITVLDGAKADDRLAGNIRQQIQRILIGEEDEVVVFTLREIKIAPCCGYFRCWIESPGSCAIKDTAEQILRNVVNSDCWVFITHVTFGGYSSELKKAIDRLPPVMLPYFMQVNGEVHHRPRYQRRSNLVVFGCAEDDDKEAEDIFRAIVARNAINFHMNKAVTKVILMNEDQRLLSQKVRDAFYEVGAIG